MSSAKRRGQARGNAPGDSGNRPSRGPNPARGRVAPFDGPASRGSGSGAGSQSQASGPPAGSRRPSDAGSRAPSQPATQPPSQSVAQTPLIGRDPAREGPAPRATDGIKNVDMPASFYNIDDMVSQFSNSPPVPLCTRPSIQMDAAYSDPLTWNVWQEMLTKGSTPSQQSSSSDPASMRLANRSR